MAITLTNLATNIDAGTGTVFNTPTITPTIGQIIFVWTYYFRNPTADISVVSGCGISFSRAQDIVTGADFAAGQIRSDLWWGIAGPGAFAGSISIDCSPSTTTTMAYSVIGATSTVGSAQLGQSTIFKATAVNYAYNLASAVAASSSVLAFWSRFTTATYTAGTGYTGLATATGSSRSVFVEYKPNAGSQAVDAIGGSTSNDNRTAAVEVLENTPPTATVTAPTGNIIGTPTVTWTYSDAQGDAQTFYQVKLFSAAQYGIGGFDPSSSPNSYDSGVVAGAGTSQVTTAIAGGAYRAYVRVSDAGSSLLFLGGFGAWNFSSFSEAFSGTAAITDAVGDLSATPTSTAIANATAAGVGDLTAFASLPEVCGPLGYGGGWYGGGSVYGGYGYCPSGTVTPITPPAVKSNVVNIDDSVGRLGCGESSFFLTSRCSGTVTCVLDGLVTSATWGRKLDDVSTATVTVDLGGDSASVCCACLSETEPWCHELHIWRDGDEVWCGPVQEIMYSYNKVVIKASDSLAWLGVRIPAANINPSVAEDITTTAVGVLNLAFSNDAGSYTCEVDNIFQQPTGFVAKLFYEAFKDTSLQILRNISAVGLNFTTLGRTIVLVGSTTPLTPLVLLNDEHIIGDLQVTKDGTLQGNKYYVHFDGDFGVPAVGEAVNKYCYNDLERILDGLGLVTGAQAGATADSYVAASAIAPRMLVIPPGSRLSPDTPWTINQMVPGARVDVAVTRLCLDLIQSFILTEVEVSYSNADGESVGITLVPLNNSPTI